MDEYYCKDEKIQEIECEKIALEWLKKREDEKFQEQIRQLFNELQ